MKKNLTRRDFLKASGGALAGVYALGLVGCSREQGGSQVEGEAADLQASGGRPLRIMEWNISEGFWTTRDWHDWNVDLPKITEQLRAQNPDIVLLNEAWSRTWRSWLPLWWPFSTTIDQVEAIASGIGLPYYRTGNTRTIKLFLDGYGWKVVGVISRYPLSNPVLHPAAAGFNTLEVTASIDGVPHRIFSTRFAPQHTEKDTEDNKENHRQAIDLLRRFAWETPMIFGADFNAEMTCSQFGGGGGSSNDNGCGEVTGSNDVNFVDDSGLADAYIEYQERLQDPCVARPPQIVCGGEKTEGPLDHIFYRGPYEVTRMEVRCPDDPPGTFPSEHPWYLVELSTVDTAPLRGYRSLQSLNYPTRFVRHAWSLGELTEIHSDLDRQDATFKIVPGLADSRYVSFESVNYPNHFLRHQDYRLKLHPRSEQWLFKADATFMPIGGLADPAATSFRSYNYPARHLRHDDFHLCVERGGGDYLNDHANDATFRVVDPLWHPSDNTPPDTTIDSGPSGIVRSTSASFAFSSNEADATFECSLDGAAYTSCTSPKGYANLREGQHTFSVRAIDGSGNIDPTPARRSWAVYLEPDCRPPPGHFCP